MDKVSFDSLFERHPDGSLEPRQQIKVGAVTFGPGVRFREGVSFAGIDFTLFKDNYFEIEQQGNIKVIRGIYK